MMEYHFILTAQREAPRGNLAIGTASGLINSNPGDTEMDLFDAAVAVFRQGNGLAETDAIVILFYRCQPNIIV